MHRNIALIMICTVHIIQTEFGVTNGRLVEVGNQMMALKSRGTISILLFGGPVAGRLVE